VCATDGDTAAAEPPGEAPAAAHAPDGALAAFAALEAARADAAAAGGGDDSGLCAVAAALRRRWSEVGLWGDSAAQQPAWFDEAAGRGAARGLPPAEALAPESLPESPRPERLLHPGPGAVGGAESGRTVLVEQLRMARELLAELRGPGDHPAGSADNADGAADRVACAAHSGPEVQRRLDRALRQLTSTRGALAQELLSLTGAPLSSKPAPPPAATRTHVGGTRRVRLVRKEGRDVSS